MAGKGPAPTPTAILQLRNSWRAKRNPDEPQPEPGIPPCPKGFTPPQRGIWQRVTRQLEIMGVIGQCDWPQLERYCVLFIRWRECEAFIAKHGTTYPVKNDEPGNYVGRLPARPARKGQPPATAAVVGFVEYPQVRDSYRLDKALKQIEQSFGLTPSARSRLTAIAAEAPVANTSKARFFRA